MDCGNFFSWLLLAIFLIGVLALFYLGNKVICEADPIKRKKRNGS